MNSLVRKLFPFRERAGPMDAVLAAVAIALIGFGVVMVYSSSVIEATVMHQDPQYYLKRQALYAGASLLTIFAVAQVDYRNLQRWTYYILGAVIVLLVLCVIGFGHESGGSSRWLQLGPIHIQPSETAKLALVFWLAHSVTKKQDRIKTFGIGILPHLIIAGGLMVLCLKQPDFGGAAVLLALTFTILFVAGARMLWLILVAMVGAAAGMWLVRSVAYRWARYLAWYDMDAHRQDLAYQPFQSVMSFGSGEATGLGLGNGFQVLYLPEAHTDFVAAIVGEELGFVGVLALCSAYLLIVARGVRAALNAHDDYGAYVAFGISVLFVLQALLNMGVAMALLPTKGLTLPFVSYGGSSLLVNAAAMGVLLNISRSRTRGNVRVAGGSARPAEASAVLASQAGFTPRHDPPRRRSDREPRVATQKEVPA